MSDLRKLWYIRRLRRNAWLKTEQLLRIQEKKLRMLLKHAYENVEYYHRKFGSVRLKPSDIRKVEDLGRLPVTTKEEVRKNFPEKITARNIDLNKCTSYSTSGSTGMPLTVVVDPKGNDYRASLFGRPFFECGLGFRDKMVFVGDRRHFPKKKEWFQKLGFLERKYLSAAEPVEKHLPEILDYKPEAIYAYPSYLFLLANAIQKLGIKGFSPKLVFSTAEVLSSQARKLIESLFDTKVFDLYGCVETERLAWECEEHVGYHMDIDSAVIEFVKDDEAVSPLEQGKMIITCLYNYAMPLIRYDIGDIGTPSDEECPCDRGLPLMKEILGRQDDFIILPNEIILTPRFFSHIVRSIPGIKQYKVIQESKSKLTMLIVKDEKFSNRTLENIATEVRKVVGKDMVIKLSVVKEIEREKSGKLRAVVSRVPIS